MSEFTIDPRTRIGNITLRVDDLERETTFYREVLGFREIRGEERVSALSAHGADPAQIVLTELRGSRPRSFSSPGLFHVAFLLPSRSELARTLKRVADHGWKFQGFADHGVSEALYLADPEGNGIELYRDRPRNEWPIKGKSIEMFTKGLDVQGLLAELDAEEEGQEAIHPATVIGHIHLQVSDLQRSGDFYSRILGFDIMQDSYPGALFVAAGGYHHHIGLNTWNSRGGLPALPDSAGLGSFAIVLPEEAGIERIRKRLEDADSGAVRLLQDGDLRFQDPDGIQIDLLLQKQDTVVQ